MSLPVSSGVTLKSQKKVGHGFLDFSKDKSS